jgi:hypothetical protein
VLVRLSETIHLLLLFTRRKEEAKRESERKRDKRENEEIQNPFSAHQQEKK